MVRVMASGVFDLIHPGHISYLQQARSFGDELVVVVACDDTVRKNKHEPITPDYMRAKIVGSLKPVDVAIVGKNNGDIFDTEKLRESLEKEGLGHIRVERATETADDLNATRRIVKKIKEMGGVQ